MKRLALLVTLAALGCGRPETHWTHPDGLYSLTFQNWTITDAPDSAALFRATPRGGKSQCWATVTTSPLSPCGTSQQCLNAAIADMTFEGSNESGFALSRRELSGVALADTAFEKGGLYWRETAFALPAPPGLALHSLHCVTALPAAETDKAALDAVLGSLKFRNLEP